MSHGQWLCSTIKSTQKELKKIKQGKLNKKKIFIVQIWGWFWIFPHISSIHYIHLCIYINILLHVCCMPDVNFCKL